MAKLLIPGMGSTSDRKAFDNVRMDGKTLDEYFRSRGIKVYHHPREDGKHVHLTTSIHRTTRAALGYAADMAGLVNDGHQVIPVLYGGLAFALPGIVAAEAYNVPVIAVGDGDDAFYNVYKIPDGTPVGVVELGNLEKGLRMADRIFMLDKGFPVHLYLGQKDLPSADAVRRSLGSFVEYDEISNLSEGIDGVTVCLLGRDFPQLNDVDRKVSLGVIAFEKDVKSSEARNVLSGLNNSLMIGRPANLGLYAARIAAAFDEEVKGKLLDFRLGEAGKYPQPIHIELEHFRG